MPHAIAAALFGLFKRLICMREQCRKAGYPVDNDATPML
jgi:hypothetical protein